MKVAMEFDAAQQACVDSGIRGIFHDASSIFGIDRTVWNEEVEEEVYIGQSLMSRTFGVTETGWDIPLVCFKEAE